MKRSDRLILILLTFGVVGNAADAGEHADHWSFSPPKHVAPPTVGDARWPQNPIDHFILARLVS